MGWTNILENAASELPQWAVFKVLERAVKFNGDIQVL